MGGRREATKLKKPTKAAQTLSDSPDENVRKQECRSSHDQESGVNESSSPVSSGRQKRVMSINETIDRIAELSESILENPDAAFSSIEIELENGRTKKQVSKMRELLILASAVVSKESSGVSREQQAQVEHTSKLAILSLLAIFKDILPDYRVRLPTAKEMAVKVSKDVKKLWDYERSLLQHYQEYLKILEKIWDQRGRKQPKRPDSLAVTSIICLCELLKSASHFNFRSNILTAVVRPMNHTNDQVSKACCDAVEYVFANDGQGDFALEATRQVAKMIRDRNLHVKPCVLRSFIALPLRVHVDEAEAAKIAERVNKKKRKRDKEGAEIEAELKESRATVDKILLARSQSDSLQAITLTYFRILKSESFEAAHIQALLPPALEGLAKFAHLINFDTVMDLLELLKGLLQQVDKLPLDAALNCILTAFSTLQGPGRELKIDQKEYILPLYSQLPRLCTESASRQHTEVVLKCLSLAFIDRREFSITRVAAFVKQIWTVALHTPPHSSIPLLAFSRQMLQHYPSVQQLTENEQDIITSGQYDPTVEDPEYSNPFATSGWELALLKFHLVPTVSSHAMDTASLKMLQLPLENPNRLRTELLFDSDNLVIPFKRNKKKHPLIPKDKDVSTEEDGSGMAVAKSTKKQRRQVRFVTPRHTECIYIPQG